VSILELSDLPPSHLRLCDQVFAQLTCAPGPWTLDCTTVGGLPGAQLGLPPGAVPLPALRDWMLAHRHNYPARDAVWRELVTRARALRGDWRIAAVGMAMPALIRFAGSLARDYRGDPADLDNEILTAFLEAVDHRVDPAAERLYSKLCWAGFRAGYAARYADAGEVFLDDVDGAGHAPYLPYAHVDLLLARAVTLRLIDTDEANLIIATRLEYHSVEQVAAATGADPAVLRMRRRRAEARVVDAIVDGLLSGGVVAPATRARLARQAAQRARARARVGAGGQGTRAVEPALAA